MTQKYFRQCFQFGLLVVVLVFLLNYQNCSRRAIDRGLNVFGSNLAGLVSYYPFDGSSDDFSENKNNGFLEGAQYAPNKNGLQNKAVSTTTGSVLVPHNESFQFLNFTVSLFFKIEEAKAPFNILVSKDYETGFGIGIVGSSAGCDSPSNTSRSLKISVHGHEKVFSSTEFACHTWYHAAITYDHSTGLVQLFVNGVFRESGTVPAGQMELNTTGLGIGKDIRSGEIFFGLLDEVYIFNRVLDRQALGILGADFSPLPSDTETGITPTPTPTPISPTPTPPVVITPTPTPEPTITPLPTPETSSSIVIPCYGTGTRVLDTFERGFYIPAGSFTKNYLNSMSFAIRAFSGGWRTVYVKATVYEGGYGGPVIATAKGVMDATGDGSHSVGLDFGTVFVDKTKAIAFKLTQLSSFNGTAISPSALYYDSWLSKPSCPLQQTNGTTPPLDTARNHKPDITIYGR